MTICINRLNVKTSTKSNISLPFSFYYEHVGISLLRTHSYTMKKNIKIKGKSIAQTSIISYREEKKKGTFETEEKKVLNLLTNNKSMTSRAIAKALQIDRTNITRSIYNLEKSNKVHVLKRAKCPTTNKLVRWYTITTNEGNKKRG